MTVTPEVPVPAPAPAPPVTTIDGLPAHPLVVHLVVVLLPLSALAVLLIAVRASWRRRYGGAVAVLTVLAVAAVPVAQHPGRQLAGALATAVVVRTGHSGAEAVWRGIAEYLLN